MKKYFKLIIITICLFLTTGCVKYNATMDIKKDKSMDFSIIYAVDKSFFGNENLIEEKDKKELENSGFIITEYNEGNMKGYTIRLNVPNIDKISVAEDIIYNLTDITNNNNDNNKKIFTIKKGFLKNTYKANLKFDSSDNKLNKDNNKDSETITEWSTEENSKDWNSIANSAVSNLDLNFKVNLPYSAKKTNATKTSNDNKELTWSLTSNEVSNIEFEFSLYNNVNIILIIVIILILIIAIIIFFINNKRSNNKSIVNENINQSNTEKQNTNNINQSGIITNTSQQNISTENNQMNNNIN